jgi:transcription-repair coupling factor (superfamily II helicase)
METKICTICNDEKDIEEFLLRTDSGTRRKSCKKCYNSKVTNYKKINKDIISLKNKKYQEINKDSRRTYRKKYHTNNKDRENTRSINYANSNQEKIASYQKSYRNDHVEKISTYGIEYRKKNKDKLNKKQRIYSKTRKSIDPAFKLRSRFSTSIWISLNSNNSTKNGNSILKYLPYSIQELKEYLEKQFEHWMNWNNWGRFSKSWDDNNLKTWKWQIDHIIPQSILPYTSMEDSNFKKCWALENLRPYSAK